jgi:hypothetical protein
MATPNPAGPMPPKEGIEGIKEFGLYYLGHKLMDTLTKSLIGHVSETTARHVKDKLPMFLGLSTEDESRWAALWSQLKNNQRKALTKFLTSLLDYERNNFRYVVVGMPEDEEKTITGAGNDKKEKITKKPTALPFLRVLAKVIETDGLDEARRQCDAGDILGQSPITKKALQAWKDGCAWFKTNVLDQLRAIDLKALANRGAELANQGAEKTADAIDRNFTQPLQRRSDGANNKWWKRLFW